jgi:hypothetical protein
MTWNEGGMTALRFGLYHPFLLFGCCRCGRRIDRHQPPPPIDQRCIRERRNETRLWFGTERATHASFSARLPPVRQGLLSVPNPRLIASASKKNRTQKRGAILAAAIGDLRLPSAAQLIQRLLLLVFCLRPDVSRPTKDVKSPHRNIAGQ